MVASKKKKYKNSKIHNNQKRMQKKQLVTGYAQFPPAERREGLQQI